MLILHEKPTDFAGLSPEEIQAVIKEYIAWRDKVEAAGQYVGSNKLADEGGRHMSLANGKVKVVDGPYAEAREVIGGYFLIKAASYDDAVSIASGCPHLKYGGRIEVRQTEQTE